MWWKLIWLDSLSFSTFASCVFVLRKRHKKTQANKIVFLAVPTWRQTTLQINFLAVIIHSRKETNVITGLKDSSWRTRAVDWLSLLVDLRSTNADYTCIIAQQNAGLFCEEVSPKWHHLVLGFSSFFHREAAKPQQATESESRTYTRQSFSAQTGNENQLQEKESKTSILVANLCKSLVHRGNNAIIPLQGNT